MRGEPPDAASAWFYMNFPPYAADDDRRFLLDDRFYIVIARHRLFSERFDRGDEPLQANFEKHVAHRPPRRIMTWR